MLFKHLRPTFFAKTTARTRDATIYLYRGFILAALHTPSRYVTAYKIYQMITLSFAIFYVPFGYIYNYIKNSDKLSPGEFMTSLQIAIKSSNYTILVLMMLTNMQRLYKANELLDQLDERCQTRAEQQQLRKNSANSNKIYLIYFFAYLSYDLMAPFSAFLTGWPPFNIYLPYIDWRADRFQFTLQIFLEVLTMGHIAVNCAVIDAYAIVYVNSLRTHLRLLIERVNKLGYGDTIDLDKRYKALIACIKDYQIMLEYYNWIRPVISKTIFTQFMVCGLVLGIIIINMMFFLEPWLLYGTLLFAIAVPCQSVPLCYFCNCLIEECEQLSNAIFHSNWFDADQRYKKTMLYFLHKTQHPITFKAFNVFPITLPTSITALKFTFTVYTLAKELHLNEKLQKWKK